jgi:hypothetical protein
MFSPAHVNELPAYTRANADNPAVPDRRSDEVNSQGAFVYS